MPVRVHERTFDHRTTSRRRCQRPADGLHKTSEPVCCSSVSSAFATAIIQPAMTDQTKYTLTLLTLAAAAVFLLYELRVFAVGAVHGTTAVATQAPDQPRRVTHTFSVLPGQAFNLPNNQFRKIEVRSEFPIRVYVGSCHSDYTVQWFCNESDPHDVFITDTRSAPLFLTPRANSVTISGTEF